MFAAGVIALVIGLVLTHEGLRYHFVRYHIGCALQFIGAVTILAVPLMEIFK